jgi:hypothetical protein
VQTTLHEARLLGHITVTERPRRGEKNLTNIVRICSREWLAWVKRGPSAARFIGSNPVKMASTMKIIDLRKQESCNKKDSADPHGLEGQKAKDQIEKDHPARSRTCISDFAFPFTPERSGCKRGVGSLRGSNL